MCGDLSGTVEIIFWIQASRPLNAMPSTRRRSERPVSFLFPAYQSRYAFGPHSTANFWKHPDSPLRIG